MELYLEGKSKMWKREVSFLRSAWVNSKQLWPGRGETGNQNEKVDQGQSMKGQGNYTKEFLMRTNYVPLADPKAFIRHHVIQFPSYFRVAKNRYEHPHIVASFILFYFLFFIKQIITMCQKDSQRKWGSQEEQQP